MALAMAAIACGGSPTDPTPSPGSPSPPSLTAISERALLGGSEFQLTWTGSTAGYKLLIGSSPGASDIATIETTGPMYTWKAPRAGTFFATVTATTNNGESRTSASLPLVSVDLRDVIDAMLFSSGPLSDTQRVNTIDSVFSIWPDGSRLTILVAPDMADVTRTRITEFIDQYASITNNAVTASISVASSGMKDWTITQVPSNTIAVRFMAPGEMAQAGICTLNPGVGCNTGGPPAPGCGCVTANLGRSITTLHAPDADYVKHELGHAYGMFHIRLPSGTKLVTLMGTGTSAGISETEAAAISLIRQRGFGRGGRRSQLVAAGLVAQ
jgi:hypothetical protein